MNPYADKTIPELRKAAIDSGYAGDPLTDAILAKLIQVGDSPLQQPAKKRYTGFAAGAGLVLLPAIVAISFLVTANNAQRMEHEKERAALVEQISSLKSEHQKAIEQFAERSKELSRIVEAAESSAKSSASAVTAHQLALESVTNQMKGLVDELRRAKAEPAPNPAR